MLDRLFFKQERVGKDGEPVTVYKIRTMAEDRGMTADDRQTRFAGGFPETDRVTLLGSILRHLGLDEIPQLINLVRGEVQLVGMRIASQEQVDMYPPELRKFYLSHKPALIGAECGYGNTDGDIGLKQQHLLLFLMEVSALEKNKSFVGVVELKLTLLRLMVMAYVYKLINPVSLNVIRRKIEMLFTEDRTQRPL